MQVVAAGGAVVDWDWVDGKLAVSAFEGFYLPVPGRLTVPRGELWGAIVDITLAEPTEPVYLGIDASYVVSGAHSDTLRLCQCPSGDLWCILCWLIDDRPGATHIRKVTAHAEKGGEHNLYDNAIPIANYVTHSLADAAAGVGILAQAVSHESLDARRGRITEALGVAIAYRLAVIQARILGALL